MKINMDELLNSMLEGISNMDYVRSEDIPNIELYMDQVTSFMDEQLSSSKRYDKDKILTKTMINNYAKNNLLPPPVKKKYSKEHVVVMIFIYYFKRSCPSRILRRFLLQLRKSILIQTVLSMLHLSTKKSATRQKARFRT